MNRWWLLFIIIVLVFVIGYTLSALRTSEGPLGSHTFTAPSATLQSITDSYSKGTHTIKGTVLVPTACTQASSTVAVRGSAIRVDITVSPDTGVCLDLPTPVMFSNAIAASSSVPVSVYINDKLSTTTP